MSTTANAVPGGNPAPSSNPAAPGNSAAPQTNDDGSPKSPKEIAREKFRQETAELVAKDAKEREKADRDTQGRFQPRSEKPSEKAPQISNKTEDAPAEKKIWKLKVDGQEVDFDASDEEAVKRALQKGYAADKRMNQAAVTTKQAERFVELLKTNPRAVLEHPGLGIDLKKMAEQIVWENMQAAAKPPKSAQEIQHEKDMAELEERRAKDKQAEAEKKQKDRDELKEKFRQDWSKKFTEVLNTAKLPVTDWTLTRMAAYMRQALANKNTAIQPADVVDMVREDWVNAQREMYGHLDGEALIKMLGDDNAEKVRKAQLARFQGGTPPREAPVDRKDAAKRYSTVEDMMRASERRR